MTGVKLHLSMYNGLIISHGIDEFHSQQTSLKIEKVPYYHENAL